MSRESSTALAIRYGDYGPIALDSRRPGEHSYSNALGVIGERVTNIDESYQRELAHAALMSLVLKQTVRNQGQFSATQESLDEDELALYDAVIGGDAETHEYVHFLRCYPQQLSVEGARLIHPNDWDVRDFIDAPVRDALTQSRAELDTELMLTGSYYKIAQFSDSLFADDPLSVTVDRKRVVMSHFGGEILTIVRNSMLIDTSSAPDDLRRYIVDEQKRRDLLTEKKKGYDYDRHDAVIGNELESHLRLRNIEEKPAWIIPLMTTYYSALKSEIKKGLDT